MCQWACNIFLLLFVCVHLRYMGTYKYTYIQVLYVFCRSLMRKGQLRSWLGQETWELFHIMIICSGEVLETIVTRHLRIIDRELVECAMNVQNFKLRWYVKWNCGSRKKAKVSKTLLHTRTISTIKWELLKCWTLHYGKIFNVTIVIKISPRTLSIQSVACIVVWMDNLILFQTNLVLTGHSVLYWNVSILFKG